MSAQPDNALTALERARQAQERFERRIDVQLRLEGTLTIRASGNPWYDASLCRPGTILDHVSAGHQSVEVIASYTRLSDGDIVLEVQ